MAARQSQRRCKFDRKGENRRTNGICFNLNSFPGFSELTITHFGDQLLANANRFQCFRATHGPGLRC